MGYNIATALFGGTAPFIAELLVSTTGDAHSPALYLSAASLVGLAAAVMLSPRRLYSEVM